MISIPEPLIKDIAEGRCLPFIGAGFSKNSRLSSGLTMPDWKELALALAKEAHVNSRGYPPNIAQSYERKFGRVQLIDAIRKSLHGEVAKPGKAHEAFVMLPFETVYTTNFDLLLEDAYLAKSRPFRSLVGELQMPFHAGRMASNIVKMHGDLRHEEHITVTKPDYDSFMTKYPVVATHLSAMLITRTPLFIGYSLTDPDFLQIRSVIRSRLGNFERMAYSIQFNCSPEDHEKALDQRVHIISLSTKGGKSRDHALAEFFEKILNRLDSEGGTKLRESRPDAFEHVEKKIVTDAITSPELASILTATSKLCFVLMPFGGQFDIVYRTLIAPVATDSGLSVIRADEMTAPGSVFEQIRVAIQQARLCIVDLTTNNPNVLFELGLAQAAGKPIILLSQSVDSLPFDISWQRVIKYTGDGSAAIESLRLAIQSVLIGDQLQKAQQLLQAGHYRASILESSIILDGGLRRLAGKTSVAETTLHSPGKISLIRVLKHLTDNQIIDGHLSSELSKVLHIRNTAVHEQATPSKADALNILNVTQRFASQFPDVF